MRAEVDLIKQGKVINTIEVKLIPIGGGEAWTEGGGLVKRVDGRWVYYVR